MASTNEHQSPQGSGPVVLFDRHLGPFNKIQPRIAQTDNRPIQGSVIDCKTSFFPRYNGFEDDLLIIKTLVAGFQTIRGHMTPLLAQELLRFLTTTWKSDRDGRAWTAESPKNHRLFSELRGHGVAPKHLNYGFWFYMAAWWGPGHPALGPIRNDMSQLWGVEFPDDTLYYPAGLGVKDQKMLFAGIADGSAHAIQRPAGKPRDTEMQVRVRDIRQKINETPVEDLFGTIPSIITRRHGMDSNHLALMKSKLASTRKELETSKQTVTSLTQDLKSLELEHENTRRLLNEKTQHFQATINQLQCESKCSKDACIELNNRTDILEAKLAEANKRAEKAVETCALVLGILSSPGGEKRKRDEKM
ncbi:hypothetical protein FBEOM_14293 [Fusarium beomiforme]|uniref:Uncharacterized protein n=1 Tax=Fusarium beomiforme TaxID=44412 RepID=A0A9P5A473_9HYPO|nr:hypothetical protein FBEOM_14293 [Fusarium beomiforme]